MRGVKESFVGKGGCRWNDPLCAERHRMVAAEWVSLGGGEVERAVDRVVVGVVNSMVGAKYVGILARYGSIRSACT